MEPAQKSDFSQLHDQLEQTQKQLSATDMLWLFSSDSHTVQKTPWPREHLLLLLQSTPWWNFNHKSWYSVSLTSNYYLWVTTLTLVVLKSYSDWSKHSDPRPIKYEKSFVSHHIKSDKGLFWKSTKIAKAAKRLKKSGFIFFQSGCIAIIRNHLLCQL